MTDDFSVLIIEDDFHVGRLHAGYVDAVPGFRALPPAPTAAQGHKAIHAERPDLVLLDVYLPDASGLDLLRSIDVDAMMLSAASDPATIRTALRRGALAYLIKPFSAGLLESRLRGYARYRRLLSETGSVGQDRLETAWQALHPTNPAAGPSAVSATETAVLAALGTRGDQSTADVAAAVGISRTTAQRYLSGLADDGAVAISLRYGSTGRPEHRYSVAPR
ncbi:putative two-component system response regulator [Arthrobacter sp. PAMC 25486]|uniref:response regulator n=1 Tax=Arthrobacter sp. PAMC 25486 TaxID=1494608 RepID=UPI00053634B2|nr:response regulator [Arthrobacter sp. PAMC 25486]AIY03545.1 putative two-component system response regulator [Arthrobacter sp. PAMC 25486]